MNDVTLREFLGHSAAKQQFIRRKAQDFGEVGHLVHSQASHEGDLAGFPLGKHLCEDCEATDQSSRGNCRRPR